MHGKSIRRNGPRFPSGGPINASSPHAERTLTLSEIDSKWQNGELTLREAKRMAAEMCGNNLAIIAVLFGGK